MTRRAQSTKPAAAVTPAAETASTEATSTETTSTETASTETASTEATSTETASTETASTEATSTETAPTETAPADDQVVVMGLDLSSGPDITTVGFGPGGDFVVGAVSNRAPYTRGGIHFASRRQRVILPPTTTPDQFRRLVADTAITLSVVHQPTGQSRDLSSDLFGTTGVPDYDRLVDLMDEFVDQVEAVEGDA